MFETAPYILYKKKLAQIEILNFTDRGNALVMDFKLKHYKSLLFIFLRFGEGPSLKS